MAPESIRSASTAPRPHRGQLIDVTDEEQPRRIRYGAQQLVHQHRIHHRGLIDNQELGRQGVVRIALELIGRRIELQQTVYRLGFQPGGLGQALGRPAGGGGEQHIDLLGAQDLDQAVDQGRLAHPGAAGDDGHLVGEQGRHRRALGG
jgi:hypothetical protein